MSEAPSSCQESANAVERLNHYERWSSEPVKRISLLNKPDGETVSRQNGKVNFRWIDLDDLQELEKSEIDEKSYTWIIIAKGSAATTINGELTNLEEGDLLFVKKGGYDIKPRGKTSIVVIDENHNQESNLIKDEPYIDYFPKDPNKTADWNGAWQDEFRGSSLHIARVCKQEKTTTIERHEHSNYTKAYLIISGVTILQAVNDSGDKKIPMGPGDISFFSSKQGHAIGNDSYSPTKLYAAGGGEFR